MLRSVSALAAAALLVAAAAGASSPTTVEVVSSKRLFTALVTHTRPLLVSHLHSWKVRLYDAKRRPVRGAQIRVSGDMPAHGHGLPTAPIAVTRGRGVYELQGMMFQMPGRWYVQLDVRADGRTDRIRISFTIAG